MTNREKIELLRTMHNAVNDQLCEAIDDDIVEAYKLEGMPMYTIGVGSTMFTFPATLAYRLLFDSLLKEWDSLDDGCGIEGARDINEDFTDLADAIEQLMEDDD